MSRVCVVFVLWTLLISVPIDLSADRKPLSRVVLKEIQHGPVRKESRYDPETRKWEKFDREGRIVYEDETGNFLLQWLGMDGQRKTIVYTPATRLDVVVEAGVAYDPEANAYLYSYSMTNLPSSQRILQSLYLETRDSVRDVKAPEKSWYSRPFTEYLKGVFKADDGWSWADTRPGQAGLLPGEKAGGMEFQSAGLPGLVRCYVRHYAKLKGVGEELPEALHAAIDRVAWQIPQGVTIGPVKPPEPFYAAGFTRNLIRLLDVSVEQGWVNESRVAEELRVLLTGVLESLEGGGQDKALTEIGELLARVEQEKENGLLSEAYALLRFNLEFLREKISTE